jgi:DNA-binding transcriptional ArsR family regulator
VFVLKPKQSGIVGTVVLKPPRVKNLNKFTINETRLLDAMYPGECYSGRQISKMVDVDLTSIEKALRRLYGKGLIDAYMYYEAGRNRRNYYRVFSVKFVSNTTLKTLSEGFQKQPFPSSSSSSSSESDSESEYLYPISKSVIRKSSEGVLV